MAFMKRSDANAVSKVKGPIRCHACRLMCSDAAHYLSHNCEPKPTPDCSAFPSIRLNTLLEF
jgi:hypothetical protein